MTRRITGLFIAFYALVFAFAALTAVRWPSLMIGIGLMARDTPMDGLSGIDWRQIGIAYGGPYLLAGISFYMSAAMVSARRKGGVVWFFMGCIAGFPSVFLIDFEPGWWTDPSLGEMGAIVAFILSLLLGAAVWDLRLARRNPAVATTKGSRAPAVASDDNIQTDTSKPKRRRWQPPPGPVPAAIARQRASFAMHGRKALQKRRW